MMKSSSAFQAVADGVALRYVRAAIVAAVVMCAAVLASQTPAHAGTVRPGPSPSYCQTHPWLTDCGGDIDD